jgi:hypothetical protein
MYSMSKSTICSYIFVHETLKKGHLQSVSLLTLELRLGRTVLSTLMGLNLISLSSLNGAMACMIYVKSIIFCVRPP